jgi:hypothetical protein
MDKEFLLNKIIYLKEIGIMNKKYMEYKQKNLDIMKDILLMIKNKDLEAINGIMELNNI